MYSATQEILMLNEKLYKQIDGVIIGNPLGHSLSNFFSGHSEKKIFANLNNNSRMLPKVYSNYIDYVYKSIAYIISCSRFLCILNSQHNDIKFNMENANKPLNFLGVQIE